MDTCLSGSNRIGESELGNKIKYDVSSSRGQQFLADIVQIPINRKDCIADIINDRQNYLPHRGDSKYFPPVSFYDDLEWHERHKYARNGIFFQRGHIWLQCKVGLFFSHLGLLIRHVSVRVSRVMFGIDSLVCDNWQNVP